MSVLNKIWKLKNEDKSASLMKKLFANRGIEGDVDAEKFLNPNAERDFHDPFLMKDMERAVLRIGTAIEKKERMMIFGDYDVDGITACAIMMRALTKLGAAVSYRLPHRIEDGYGLREKFIKEFSKLDVKLVITVDNGISCFNEVELANKLGVDIIITDHHTVPEKIPNAFAILHPKLPGSEYPFAELTGAGVALKLAQALFARRLKEPEEELSKLLDLACMGTIADMGPLLGENRYIVKEGLKVLENTRWPGLSRLKESAGIKGKVSAHAIGFLLGPRINAAGRISHPSHALKLLLQSEEHSELLANQLEQLNAKRQRMMSDLMEIADVIAAAKCKEPIIIISHPKFHGGIIGLIAAKIAEKYFRPVIAMEERSDTFVGSCRSIPAINIVEVLASVKDLLTHFGGHAAAAGFDLPRKKLKEFSKRISAHVKSLLSAADCKPILETECEIDHTDISMKTIEMLRWFEPFGKGNVVPAFVCRNVPVLEKSTVGAEKQHLKLKVQANGSVIDCIGFRLGEFSGKLQDAKYLDLVCEIEEDTWRGNKKIQLKIQDFEVVK
ncbi:MAG: single-stranded-DNA-specific exonuclease RecJ [Patescibacteria group bacterium]